MVSRFTTWTLSSLFSHHSSQVPKCLPHHAPVPQTPGPHLLVRPYCLPVRLSTLSLGWRELTVHPVRSPSTDQNLYCLLAGPRPLPWAPHRRLLVRPPCLPVRSLDSWSQSVVASTLSRSQYSLSVLNSQSHTETLLSELQDNHQVSGLLPPPEVSIFSNQSSCPVVAALKGCHHWSVISWTFQNPI